MIPAGSPPRDLSRAPHLKWVQVHMAGVKYNEKADKRSWEAMKQFFAEIFR